MRHSAIGGHVLQNCQLTGTLCKSEAFANDAYHKEFNRVTFIDSRIDVTATGIDCVHSTFNNTTLAGQYEPSCAGKYKGRETPPQPRFFRCAFNSATLSGNFKHLSFSGSEFDDCQFTGQFDRAKWHGVTISNSDISALVQAGRNVSLVRAKALSGCYVKTFEQGVSLLFSMSPKQLPELNWEKMPFSLEDANQFLAAYQQGCAVIERETKGEPDKEIRRKERTLANNLIKNAKGCDNFKELADKLLKRRSAWTLGLCTRRHNSKTNTVANTLKGQFTDPGRQAADATDDENVALLTNPQR
jgi:hypothetical protein